MRSCMYPSQQKLGPHPSGDSLGHKIDEKLLPPLQIVRQGDLSEKLLQQPRFKFQIPLIFIFVNFCQAPLFLKHHLTGTKHPPMIISYIYIHIVQFLHNVFSSQALNYNLADTKPPHLFISSAWIDKSKCRRQVHTLQPVPDMTSVLKSG